MPVSAPALSPVRSVRVKFSLLVLAVCAALGMSGRDNRADAQCAGTGTTTYTSTGGVSVPGGTGQKTSTNTIIVPTLPAGSTITCVSVVLTGVTSDGQNYESMDYASFMLTAPSGQEFEFLGSTGDGTDGDDLNDAGSGLDNVNITVADNATNAAPREPSVWPHTGSVTVKPGSYYNYAPANSQEQPPLPVGGNSTEWAQSDGTATFANQFTTGATPSGNWTLTLTDNDLIGILNGDPVSVTGWSLVMTVAVTANANTTTTLSSSSTNNSSFTSGSGNAVTFTADVTSTSAVDVGTVKFTDGGINLSCSQGNPVAVSSGSAQCTTSFSTEGIHTIEGAYSGGTGLNPSNSSGLNQFVKNHSTLTSGEYCNTGAIVENNSTVSPYPSVINVGTDTSALSGTVANVTVTLKGLSDTQGLGISDAFLLVAPDRSKAYDLDFMSDVGTSSGQSSVNLTFADLNSSAPIDGPLVSGTYEATDNRSQADTFPASQTPAPSVPGTINYPQPDFFGSNPFTFAQAFGGANGNGDWALFAINNTGTIINVTGGWCLAFEVNNGAPTTTTIVPSANPASTGNSVTFTATVKSGGSPVTSGTVTFTENGVAPAGVGSNTVALSGTGTASISTSALTEGDHNITATYNGVANTYDPSSNSTPFWERVDTKSTVTGTNPVTVCNPGGITLPNQAPSADNIGAAAPNPSNIFVSNLPGSLSSVDVDLVNFKTDSLADSVLWTSSLLVGPGANAASSIDFFSGTGATNNDTLLTLGNYIFSDSGSELVPQANYAPGTYKPTSYANSQIKGSYTASPSGFYALPGSYNYAAPRGTTTFEDLYNDTTNPNGTWSLYFYQNTSLDSPATATAWCMDFNLTLPAVTATTGHTGNFTQGQQNAEFTVDIDNNGPGSTGDPSGNASHPITVTDTLNSAFTYSSFSGTDWNCSANAQVVTCTNDDSVPHPGAYNELTIDVNVAANAGTPISNQVTVSGAEISASTNSNTDSITVVPSTVLGVVKSHTGTFTQGSTAEWDVAVYNLASSGSSSGTVTVVDTLPTNYTVSSFGTNTGWSCGGTTTVTCTSTTSVAGGGSFPTIQIFVNVPVASPISVTNNVVAYGGGDANHTNSGNGATSFSTVSVVQVPATITVNGGGTQSAPVGMAFGTPLAVTVKDANGVVISGSSVIFTAPPETGASGTFSNTTNTVTTSTNSSGIATAGTFTANSNAGGPYLVTVTDSPATSTSFSLTNTAGTATHFSISAPSATTAGVAFNFTVTALDASNNIATGYSGTVHFTTSDIGPGHVLPGNFTFINGTHTFSATLVTAGSQSVTATDTSNPLLTAPAPISVIAGPAATFQISTPPSTVVGAPFNFTVSAYDLYGNLATGYAGSVAFTSSDSGATLPAPVTFSLGASGTLSATLVTVGSQTIKATDTTTPALNATSSGIQVNPPSNFVVTTPNDDNPAVATNCTPQTTPGTGTDADCSLRDALASIASAGGGNITFDSTKFAVTNTTAQNTITLTYGLLVIPNKTTIQGLTTGSGATLTNLVTVSGNSTSPVFAVGSGKTASIANLTIANGSNLPFGYGAAINTTGNLTVTESTFSSNTATQGGAIYNTGTLVVNGSAFLGNSGKGGGGILNLGTARVTNCTFSRNNAGGASVDGGGDGVASEGGTMSVTGSTFAGNLGGVDVMDLGGTINVTNSILTEGTDNLSALLSATGTVNADHDLFLSGTYACSNCATNTSPVTASSASISGLGSYGGPTQTILPLPGSPAICAGTLANATAAGLTTDQRGLPFDPACSTGSVDSGAVQTNYALNFTAQEPSSVAASVAMSPAPIVTVTESGNPLTAGSASISITDANSDLTTTPATASTSTSNGEATFSSLIFTSPTTDDTLTATLVLSTSPALSLTTSSTSVDVTQIAPTLTFVPSPGTQTYGTAIAAGSLDATATASSNPVPGSFAYTTTISSVPNQPVAAGTTILPVGSYTITATFTPTNTAEYSSTSTSASYSVTTATATLTLPTASAITFGQTLASSTLSGGSALSGSTPVQGTFAFTTPTTAPPAGTQSESVTFTPTDTTNYSPVVSSVNVLVNKATPTLTLPTASAITFGQTLASSTLSGGSAISGSTPVAGMFTFTTPTAAPPAGTQSESVTFTPTNTTDYLPVVSAVSVLVNKATPTLTLPTASAITFGQTLASSTLTGGSAIAGSTPVLGAFVFTTPTTAPPPGTQSESVTFTPTDTTDYLPVVSAVSVLVNKATPTLTLPTASVITFGQTLASSTLSGGSAMVGSTPVAGMFTFTTPTTAPPPGTQSESVTFTPTSTTDYSPVVSAVSVLVNKATPTLTLPTASAITYGQTLASSTLSGGSAVSPITSATVPGTFAFTIPTTAPHAGLQPESVTFTPSNTTDYSIMTSIVNVLVNKATPVLTWHPASIELGFSLGAAQLDATANVPGGFVYTPPSGTPVVTTTELLSVLFTPADTVDFNTSSLSAVPVTVTAGPLATLSPSTLPFGTVYLGTLTPKTVTLTNTGNATMTINDPLLSIAKGGDSSEFVVLSLCPRSLAAGKSCTIFVTFVAGPFFNPQTATLSIMDNVPGSPQQVSLTAQVIDPLALPSVINWNFGTQKVNTSSAPKAITLSNPGLTALTINSNSITISGGNSSDFSETNNCPASLAPKTSCTIDVAFKPTAKGLRSSSLVIIDNAFNNPQRISLSGTGN